MKTLLLPTDFSADAKHAVEYGYNIACHIQANVVLCNAFIVPSEVPQAGMVVWPLANYNALIKDNTDALNDLKKHLESKKADTGFSPVIDLVNETGKVTEVVRNIIATKNIDMVVAGVHRAGLSSLLIGNHTKKLIDFITSPLLLVPPHAKIKAPDKIAFATDFKHPEKDLELLHNLVPFAKALGAEIFITHVYNEKDHKDNFKVWFSQFLTDLSKKADYPFIFSKVIRSANAVSGFDKLCKQGEMDMLIMVHRPHSFFENLFKGSHTQKMADHINIPLLIFPSNSTTDYSTKAHDNAHIISHQA
jgi:nucleotide-binding universal stress UspA family protein